MADVKRVYTFGNKEAEGNGKMRELLGGKGANLAEMNLIGIPVPTGFTITTEVCAEFYKHGKEAVIEMLRPEVEKAMKNIEKLTGMKFGDKEMPLLVSVRSGARASMPGMMDTILNLGLNDQAEEAVAKRTNNTKNAINDKGSYDLCMVDGSWMAEFTENGVLANLTELGYSLDEDVKHATTTICYVGDDLYLAPYYGNLTVLLYNKANVDAAGYTGDTILPLEDMLAIC